MHIAAVPSGDTMHHESDSQIGQGSRFVTRFHFAIA
jgi:hypothetical protein